MTTQKIHVVSYQNQAIPPENFPLKAFTSFEKAKAYAEQEEESDGFHHWVDSIMLEVE